MEYWFIDIERNLIHMNNTKNNAPKNMKNLQFCIELTSLRYQKTIYISQSFLTMTKL